MNFNVRRTFYVIACLVTLAFSGTGAYTLLSAGMRQVWLTEADQVYSLSYTTDGSQETRKKEIEEVERKNAISKRQKDFAWAIPILVINLPLFLYFYPEVKKKEE